MSYLVLVGPDSRLAQGRLTETVAQGTRRLLALTSFDSTVEYNYAESNEGSICRLF